MIQIIEKWRLMHATHVKENTANTLERMLEKHLYPRIVGKDADKVRPVEALVLINELHDCSSSYIANRILAILVNVYNYASIMGIVYYNPFACLHKFVPAHKEKGMSFLPPREFSQLLRNIDTTSRSSKTVRNAFYALTYTALRRNEAIAGQWQEVDFVAGTWTVPAERMKMREDHIIPITPSLNTLLQEQRGHSERWIFPSLRQSLNQPINPAAPYYLIQRAGYSKRQTLHGIRKVFSTRANDCGMWSDKLIERQLDHRPRGVAGVYDKSAILDERRRLMTWWEDQVNQWRGAT